MVYSTELFGIFTHFTIQTKFDIRFSPTHKMYYDQRNFDNQL